MTLSSIDISSNVAGTWKVRPMPSRAWVAALARVTSMSENTMRPVVGGMSPATQLKKVDLPAPFGPIRPTISPSLTSRLAFDSATKLPKLRETSRALSSMAHRDGFTPAQPALRHLAPEIEQPAGLEPRQDHDDAAVEDVGEPRAAAAEQRVGHGLQRNEDDGAEQRTEQGPGAAERRDDDHLDRAQDAEAALGIDEADHQRIERAGERSESGREQQRVELIARDRDAEAPRRPLAGADGAPIVTHSAALQVPGEHQQAGEHDEEQIIIGNGTAEREVEPGARHRWSHQAGRRAHEVPVADGDADQVGDRDGGHGEIMAVQAERGQPDDDRNAEADHDRERHAGDRGKSEMGEREQRQIGADAEEHRMADRDLPGVTAQDVPRRGADRRDQHVGAHAAVEIVGDHPRIEDKQSRDEDAEPDHAPALPNRPSEEHTSELQSRFGI